MAGGKMGLYIPRALIEDTQLSPPTRMVLAVMIESADADDICRKTAKDIADRCGMTASTASTNRKVLMRLGYVEHASRDWKKKKYGPSNFRILRHRAAK